MKRLKAEPRERQRAELLTSPETAAIRGYTFLGGRVGIGEAAEVLRGLDYHRLRQPTIRTVLGSLALATAGTKNKEIVEGVKALPGTSERVSSDDVNHIIVAINHEVGAMRRHRLLPELLKRRIFLIEEFGALDNFRATVYELARVGLVARGVDWSVVAEACGNSEGTFSNDLSQMGKREGVYGTAGCIAGGILTRQLGATSCVPLLHSKESPGQVRPLMPVADWDNLVAVQNADVLKGLFARLAA